MFLSWFIGHAKGACNRLAMHGLLDFSGCSNSHILATAMLFNSCELAFAHRAVQIFLNGNNSSVRLNASQFAIKPILERL